MFLENKLKKLENNTNYNENLEYIDCRNKLDKIYEQKINGIRIRSKCDWYEHGEKSSKFFLNLEKTRSTQSTIRNITKDKKNLTCHKKINQELFDFYKGLFSENLNVSKNEIMQFLNLVSIPQLTEDQSKDCEFILSEKDLLLVLKSMPNNKPSSLQKNSMRFSARILKTLLYQVLNQYLINVNSVILKSKR